MLEYHEQWPQYGFDKHKGYGTARHLEALAEYGPCPIHRVSYEPVRLVKDQKDQKDQKVKDQKDKKDQKELVMST